MKNRFALFALMLLTAVTLTSAVYAQDEAAEPVTLRLTSTSFPTTLDPLFVQAVADAQYVSNLFTGLTRIDPVSGQPEPALASQWSISLDGLTWTFTLRGDVPWVRFDPVTGQFESIRPVVADDLLFAYQRMCSSADNGYYAVDVFGPRIAGCAEAQAAGDGSLVQVAAPDATTFSVTLTAPVPYFDALAALWTVYPLPREVLEGFPAIWTQPGTIQTNGAFGLVNFSENDRITLAANPFLPADLREGGNVTRVEGTRVDSVRTAFRFYRDGLADRAPVPASQMETLVADEAFAGQISQIPDLSVFYMGFSTDLAPFDDVALRRAFSAALDRDRFINEVRQGRGTPVDHFAPEGIAFAPPRALETTVGFNPDYARQQLAASGYPDCQGLPPVQIVTYSGADGWASFLVQSAVEVLGCDETLFSIERLEFDALRAAIDPAAPAETRPNMFTFGWGPDYNDASSFADVLACGTENRFRRACSPVDGLIREASTSTDPAQREALYAQIETAFFGADGEFPMIPLFQLTATIAVKPWLSGPFETDMLFGGKHFDAYTIDVAQRGAVIACDITTAGEEVNVRGGPGTNFDRVGVLAPNSTTRAIAQTQGTDGFLWWYLETQQWVREDVVGEQGSCNALPQFEN